MCIYDQSLFDEIASFKGARKHIEVFNLILYKTSSIQVCKTKTFFFLKILRITKQYTVKLLSHHLMENIFLYTYRYFLIYVFKLRLWNRDIMTSQFFTLGCLFKTMNRQFKWYEWLVHLKYTAAGCHISCQVPRPHLCHRNATHRFCVYIQFSNIFLREIVFTPFLHYMIPSAMYLIV